jgi:CheY-like chemotaxis protein
MKPLRHSQLVKALADALKVEPIARGLAMAAESAESTTEAQRSLRILVAEDNPVNQEVTRRLLESRGHRADMVANGKEAIDAARNFAYDIILMDLQMPDVDGLVATRGIRALGGWAASVPIIAMTARVIAGSVEECLDSGMNDYLSKPVSPKHLFGVPATGFSQAPPPSPAHGRRQCRPPAPGPRPWPAPSRGWRHGPAAAPGPVRFP